MGKAQQDQKGPAEVSNNLSEVKKPNPPKKHQSQKAFQIASYALATVTVFCVPGFLKFRTWAVDNNVLVLKAESIWWIIPGFLAMLTLKALFDSQFAQKHILTWLRQEDRVKKQSQTYHMKLIALTKAIRDTVVHFVIVVTTYALFRGEYWFTWFLGGSGDHLEAFREFPAWPAHLSSEIEIFFMVQLGINIYLLLDLTVFNRKFTITQNYYEILMHHIAAVTAIIFSTLCNISAVVTLIFFIHDVSDLFRAACRLYCDSKWAKFIPALIFDIVFLVMWIYNRIIIFPYCLIYVLEKHGHSEGEAMDVIAFEYWFLIIVYCALYVLHVFWTYLLVRVTYKKAMTIRKQEKEDKNKQLKKQ